MLSILRNCKRSFHFNRRDRTKVRPFDFSFSKLRRTYDPFYEDSIYGDVPRSKEGGKYFITMLKGTGTGPELMGAIQTVFECTNVPVTFDIFDIPSEANDDEFFDVVSSIRRCGACIKGFIEGSMSENPLSRNMIIRNDLKLYAYLRHFRSYPAIPTTKNCNIDLVLVSQNIEGEYSKLEHSPIPSMVQSMKIVTREKTANLAKFTFDIAQRSERNHVMCVIAPKITPRLYTDTISEIAKQYPDINFEIVSTKRAMQHLMMAPENVEVLLAESLSGSIIGACLFGLIGSPLLVAGCNYGDRYAVFEPGSRTQNLELAGKGIANPTSALLCGVQLLRYLDICEHAEALEDAVIQTVVQDRYFTPDVGGTATTKQFLRNVIRRVRSKMGVISQCCYDDPPIIPPPPSQPTLPFDPELHREFTACGSLREEDL